MSHVTRYYINEILKNVCELMSDVSKNVYPEHRPVGKEDGSNEMIVVSIPSYIDDQKVYQKTFLRIELMVKDRSNGVSHTKRLGELLDSVINKFPIVCKRYSITNPKLTLKGYDGLGFTVWNIQAKLLINTTDSYV